MHRSAQEEIEADMEEICEMAKLCVMYMSNNKIF